VKESDVYAEIGEVVSGKKKGREGDELILVDLTGTGAQVGKEGGREGRGGGG
jgi:ornithine cyclodeaminase/alanine dehydrogenase-like protein (mu-crystallin family)